LPELTFNIGGKNYRVPRASLYKPYGWHKKNCYVEVTALDSWEEWILGLTFLENYYAVYDQENLQVGFAESITSKLGETGNPQTLLTDTHNKVAENDLSLLWTILAFIGGILVFLMLVLGIEKIKSCFTSKKKTEDDDQFVKQD